MGHSTGYEQTLAQGACPGFLSALHAVCQSSGADQQAGLTKKAICSFCLLSFDWTVSPSMYTLNHGINLTWDGVKLSFKRFDFQNMFSVLENNSIQSQHSDLWPVGMWLVLVQSDPHLRVIWHEVFHSDWGSERRKTTLTLVNSTLWKTTQKWDKLTLGLRI